MIIRAQNSFNFINFDNVKIIGIESYGGKFRIVARTTKSDETIGTILAEYSCDIYAKKELKRFYQAYAAGDETFMFRGDSTSEFLFYDENAMAAEALSEFFERMVLNPEKFIEDILNIAKEEAKAKEEIDGSRKEI